MLTRSIFPLSAASASSARSVAACLAVFALVATLPAQRLAAQAAGMDEHMMHMSAADLASPHLVARADQQAGLPASASTAAARIESSPRHAEWVTIPWEAGSSDSLMAWIVYPVTSDSSTPVVVVIHEIFGLSTWARSVADQLAADGFIAIAPDLLSRVRGGPSTNELSSDSARSIIRGVSIAERNMGVTAAARYAMSRPSAGDTYGVIGFCWGGSTTWYYAINGGIEGYSGGVAYYGLPYTNDREPVVDSLAKIKEPIMLLSGSKDARIGSTMPAVDSIMKSLGKDYFGRNYEGAIHGFLRAQDDPGRQSNPAQEAANLAATKDAWPRTIRFLREHLGSN